MNRILKPAALAPDSTFSVVAPASPAESLRVGIGFDALRALGFKPDLAPNAAQSGPLYFAGSPAQRLADLHDSFTNPNSSALISLRGGYGSNYLLGGLDLDLIAAHPKPFLAYSDLTGLQLCLLDRIGLPAADICRPDGLHQASFRAALSGQPYGLGPAEGLRTLKPGAQNSIRGTLYGGCLSIITALLGTPWEPATEGKLLFLEDIAAKPYQIDRMLWQLRAAGKLEGVPAIIFGEMLNCASPGAPSDLLDQAILSALDGLNVPIAIGLRSGHVSRQNVTLTFGVEAQLTLGDETRLDLLEAAVV